MTEKEYDPCSTCEHFRSYAATYWEPADYDCAKGYPEPGDPERDYAEDNPCPGYGYALELDPCWRSARGLQSAYNACQVCGLDLVTMALDDYNMCMYW
jgi:hypothetical protein